eukprot:10131096-Prorocentrum_lima.AAC.1
MTSSLVGSEMCIRDSHWAPHGDSGSNPDSDRGRISATLQSSASFDAVSYTHLTLPTICSV